jgi:transposase
MLGRNTSEPALFQMVDVEALVPAGHLLRRVDAVLDLSFVREAVAECYSAGSGRPGIDPELAVRIMLLGVLYDIGDRELCDEIGMHAGMRWFCRLNFHDPVPDHSTLSRLRNERWAQSGLFDRLMDEVIRQCCEAGLVSGRHLSVDGTEVRADASMKSLERRGPQPTPPDPPDPPGPPGSGSVRGQEPKPAGEWKGRGVRYRNDTHVSSTDPDARLYRKGDSREARLSYLVHDLIDTKSRVILGRRASEAMGATEREVGLAMLDDVLERQEELGLGQRPEILTGDANYGASHFVTDVLARDVVPHVPLLAGEAIEEIPTWTRPTFDLARRRARDRRVAEATARNLVRDIHCTRGYQVSRKLRIRSEHVFAEGKCQHGLDRARRRGLSRVQDQATLTAVVQNLKRLAAFVARRRRGAQAMVAQPPSRDTLFASRPRTAGTFTPQRPLRRLLALFRTHSRARSTPLFRFEHRRRHLQFAHSSTAF